MYRSVETGLWTDPKIKPLPSIDKLLFVYLITNPHSHLCGLYYLPMFLIAHELGIGDRGAKTGMLKLEKSAIVKYDIAHEVVWVINMLKYQARGPKNLKATADQLRSMHGCVLISCFLDHYIGYDIPYSIPNPEKIESADRVSHTHSSKKSDSAGTGEGTGEGTEQKQNTPNPPSGGVAASNEAEDAFPGFDRFWFTWPANERKVDRAGCLRKWKRKNLELQTPAILVGLERWKGSRAWADGFAPMPGTWLNQSRWEVTSIEQSGDAQANVDAALGLAPTREPTLEEINGGGNG